MCQGTGLEAVIYSPSSHSSMYSRKSGPFALPAGTQALIFPAIIILQNGMTWSAEY